ncbi:conserved hypothetical protein [Streptococcus intermedius JTH08]|nr:conserved hypothetical protein [Streptococcus intermedius JTH08]
MQQSKWSALSVYGWDVAIQRNICAVDHCIRCLFDGSQKKRSEYEKKITNVDSATVSCPCYDCGSLFCLREVFNLSHPSFMESEPSFYWVYLDGKCCGTYFIWPDFCCL